MAVVKAKETAALEPSGCRFDQIPASGKAQEEGELRYAIDIVSLSKRFRRVTVARAGYTTIKSSFFNLFFDKDRRQARYTNVIRDLTMRIPQGSSVGIIGKNGSGKSTLLKLITGIYKPDQGCVRVNGRVAALIELGAGFHPDFTGRENLYLGGVMHGLTRQEIRKRFDRIVRFAELEDVIDDPIRTYSSGMFMRLGFSLAVHTDPDLLLIDEVLAVGDIAFVSKCKDRISQLRKEGKTLLLVSHDLDAVERWCDEVLWIDDGLVKDRGEPRRVIDHYRQYLEKSEEAELIEDSRNAQEQAAEPRAAADGQEAQRWGSREIEISRVRILNAAGDARQLFHPEDALVIEIDYHCRQEIGDAVFGIGIKRADGLLMHGSNTDIERVEIKKIAESGTVRYRIDRLGLLAGSYSIDVAVHKHDGYPYDYQVAAMNFVVRSAEKQVGVYLPEHRWLVD